ncbi:trigger factor [Culicoidibacter larvae]|uniref:Trigger factor n=1 Tax=Culicoidibacter larvae TaxID=2579976 RepID=A0A5R8QGQ0_9FIRM|nr:trigger factor [Culicoidibacter larvae]TLG76643.1 trigger factor [Culicoidibacter larvae]
MSNTKFEKLEGNRVKLTMTISKEQFEKAMDAAFNDVVKDVQMEGFRKGHVPRPIFEKKYGKESLYNDAIDKVLPDAYRDALEEHDVLPVAYPQINIEKFEPENEIIITAEVAVKPEVALGNYKGLKVEKLDIVASKEDIEAEIDKLKERFAEMVVKDAKGKVEDGDTAVIDFEGFKDGVAFEGGKGENYPLTIGSGSFIPGFEEQLIGAKAGDAVEVKVTFPEQYQAADLAGQDVVFNVTVHEVKHRVLPELSDDFVEELDMENVKTLEDLQAYAKEQAETAKQSEADSHLRNEVLRLATEGTKVDIPEEMVDAQVDHMIQDFERQLSMQGMQLAQYLEMTGSDEAAVREQMRPDAANQILTSLTLEAIAEAEGIAVTDEDVNAEMQKMSEMYGIEIDELKKMLPNLDGMKQDLVIQKAIDFLIDNVK